MDPIRIAGFLGSNQALHPKLLPDGVGVSSLNQKPGKGDLRPWKVPLNVATVPSGRKTIYRFNKDTASDTNYWFSWSTIVHAVRGFIGDDTTERTYYTGSGAPKVTDNIIGIAGAPYPTAYRDLGVPAPITAPTLTQTTAGTGTDEDRYYVYTYLTDHGEESAPSPVSARVTCKPGALFNITNLSAVPSGSYGITMIRIYRTKAGTSGNAEFYFLREIVAALTSTDDARALGADTLPSTYWAMPPSDLRGLTPLWNGMMAGITGKAVRYCEPFKPYAWPVAYVTLCTDTPVALATFGKNVLILTTGAPRLAYGSAPEAMDDEPVAFIAACVAATGVVSFKHGACWPTADGLAYAGSGAAPRIITEGLMLREDWQAINPSTIVAGQYAGRYMGFYDSGSGVLKGFMIDPLAPLGIYFFDTGYSAVYFDELQEALYVLDGVNIRKWDAGATNMTATFRSKVFRSPAPTNLAVAEVIADTYPVTFKIWSDSTNALTQATTMVLRLTRSVLNSDTFTLPSGYLSDNFQVEVSTAGGSITGVAVAVSVDDIKQV